MGFSIEQVEWSARQVDLLRVRHAVFVDEQGVPADLEHDENDRGALHLLAVNDAGKPVGTARMLADGHIGRMAVLADWRGRGIGTALLQTLVRIAAQQGLNAVFLNAQCRAEPFYARNGFDADGGTFEDAGIAHRRMSLQLDPGSG